MYTASLRISDSNELLFALELWLEALQARGATQQTLKNYRQCVTPFVTFLEQQGCTALEQVQPYHIRRWLLNRQQKGISSHTLHNSYRNPRAFWNWCIREGLTENNPFAKVEPPKKELVLKRALTPEEVEKLLQACEGKDWLKLRDKALILLLLDTGLRIHEAHSLRVCDVAQETVVIKGKGGKQRLVVLSADVRLAIARYLKACPYKPTGEQPLWYGRYGALTSAGIKEVIRFAGQRAGVKVRAHQLRRTFATWSLRNGIDLEHLRLLMGHSDYKVLQQYLALVEQDLKQAHQQHSPLRLLRKQR